MGAKFKALSPQGLGQVFRIRPPTLQGDLRVKIPNLEKRVSELTFPIAPEKGALTRKGRFESKTPHFLVVPCREMVFFVIQNALFESKCPLLGRREMGVFLAPQPSFPDFGDFDPVGWADGFVRQVCVFSCAMALDGRDRAIVTAEWLVRVITTIRITSVRWRSYFPSKTQNLVLICPAFVVPRFESHGWRSFV